MTDCTIARIAALPQMDYKELRALWDELFDAPPNNANRDFMARKLAWRIQEIRYGGLSADTKSRLKKLRSNAGALRSRKKSLPPVGTQLIREHGGEDHRVTVLADGFEYRGCKYRSLSEIARLITGTRWSGPKFFGLKS